MRRSFGLASFGIGLLSIGVLVGVCIVRRPHDETAAFETPGSRALVTPAQPRRPLSASPPSAASEEPSSCDGIGPPPPDHCAPATDAVASVVRAASRFVPGGVFCMLGARIDAEAMKATPKMLATLASMPVAGLSQTERIVAQNAALRLSLCGEALGLDRSVVVLALKAVSHFAYTPAELDALGDAVDPSIAAFIGAPSGWIDRKPPGDVLFHERGFGLTRTSRPMRASEVWANVGQLVAIDTVWHAHVTPVVGRLDLRRGGATCTATLDVAWLRCGVPLGLHVVDESAPASSAPDGLLFATHAESMQCAMCHGGGRAASREAALVAGDLATRREGSRTELERRIAALRAAQR